MKRLIIDLNNKAPVDQLLWSVWGLCVVDEIGSGTAYELVLFREGMLLAGLKQALTQMASAPLLWSSVSPLDQNAEYALVSSSAVVSRRLLGFLETVHVKPSGPLHLLAPDFFWDITWMELFRRRVEKLAKQLLGKPEHVSVRKFISLLGLANSPVSLISSVFAADNFLPHFLNDCSQLNGYADYEHWLVRPGSPGNEHKLLAEHVETWPRAIYLNMPVDPGLYATWNLVCCLAQGRFLSTANVDDRRHPQHTQRLIKALETRPSLDLASVALRVSTLPNQDWSDWSGGEVLYAKDDEKDYGGTELVREAEGKLRPRNIPHCMPVWRRGLHGLRGFFNESNYGPSADWEYWLRCASSGSRFYHVPSILGSYLKRDDSYWHRSGTGDRSEAILARYTGALDADKSILSILPWQELTRFSTTENWFGVLLCLVRLNSLSNEMEASGLRAKEVARAQARHYFGLVNFESIPSEWLQGGFDAVLSKLEPKLLEWLHASLGGMHVQSAQTNSIQRRWHSLLIDWHALDGNSVPLLGLALMLRSLNNDQNAERATWCQIYAQDPEGFWRGFQRVYRFTVPLETVVETVGAMRIHTNQTSTPSLTKLIYFPAYSNPYQRLLYQAIQADGMILQPVSELSILASLTPKPGYTNIIHVHWLNAIFTEQTVGFEQAAEDFIVLIRKLKERGFILFWTVHNRVSHESPDPNSEAKLRTEVAMLVDRVYLHHPLQFSQLDWLPEEITPWLCEHGPYEVHDVSQIDRSVIRRELGLESDERVLLWFGRIRPYKGLDEWLPIIHDQLLKNHRTRLVIVGESDPSQLQGLLERYRTKVLFIDRFVSDAELQKLASIADFGLLTYQTVLTSGAMFRFYSMGLPIIAPDQGALPAYVVPGWNGFLYNNADNLRAVLNQVFGLSRKQLSEFHDAARRTADGLRWGYIGL